MNTDILMETLVKQLQICKVLCLHKMNILVPHTYQMPCSPLG